MTTSTTFRTRKMSDIEALLPGFAKAWKAIKAQTGTKQRCPKTVTFSAKPEPMYPNDSSCCRRFPLDLFTMKVGGGVHVSAGEWAVHAGSNNDGAVDGLPTNVAMIDCEWNDFYGSFSMRIQLNPANMPKASLPA